MADFSEISAQIKIDIDKYFERTQPREFRTRLGASDIGKDCDRFLWYSFRWVWKDVVAGWHLRLFDLGTREEKQFTKWLRGAGFEVYDIDPETKKQYTITDACGHFGGSLDAWGHFPKSYGITKPVLFEYKTNKTGAAFNDLLKEGFKKQKPEHFGQCCVYGVKRELEHVVYLNENKNDSNIHAEVEELDFVKGNQLIARANNIVFSETPPAKISDDPTFWKCKFCSMNKTCHFEKPVLKNCRSCKNAMPVENAQWNCKIYGIIPKEFIAQGCGEHTAIVNA